MSEVLKCLKIYDFPTLYLASKISFLNFLKINNICLEIFDHMCQNLDNIPTSFQSLTNGIKLLTNYFNMDIELAFAGPAILKGGLRSDAFMRFDGLTDSINLCLKKSNIPLFRTMLNDLIRPSFLQEYNEILHEIID